MVRIPANSIPMTHSLVPVSCPVAGEPMPSAKIMGDASAGGMPKVRFFERQLVSPRILERIPPQARSSGWMVFVTVISQSPVLVFRFDWHLLITSQLKKQKGRDNAPLLPFCLV